MLCDPVYEMWLSKSAQASETEVAISQFSIFSAQTVKATNIFGTRNEQHINIITVRQSCGLMNVTCSTPVILQVKGQSNCERKNEFPSVHVTFVYSCWLVCNMAE